MNQIVEFVLYPGAIGLDITGPLEVFNTAATITGQKQPKNTAYTPRFVAATVGPVPLSSGLEIFANTSFAESLPADILLVPGSSDVSSRIQDPIFMDYIRRRAVSVKRIVSVCKGAFILAAAGLLEGKEATTHWRFTDKLAKQYPSIQVKPDAIFTRDGNVYTSAGVTAGIDLALSIVEEDLGTSIALKVAKFLVVYFPRPGSFSQFSVPLQAQEAAGKSFSKLHNWLLNNLHKPISVEQMAEYVNMSERNFARIFKVQTKQTPNKYLEILRLEKAREILSTGVESVEQIAGICGFARAERLRRAFLRHFGLTPSEYRQNNKNS